MDSPVYYARRGGALVAGRFASWPFGKIEISGEAVTVRVMGKAKTLRVAEVLRVEPLGLFSSEGGAGLRIFYRGQHWEEYVDFYSRPGRDEILAELRRAGFNVVEPPSS